MYFFFVENLDYLALKEEKTKAQRKVFSHQKLKWEKQQENQKRSSFF